MAAAKKDERVALTRAEISITSHFYEEDGSVSERPKVKIVHSGEYVDLTRQDLVKLEEVAVDAAKEMVEYGKKMTATKG